jgi:hypothetical protein
MFELSRPGKCCEEPMTSVTHNSAEREKGNKYRGGGACFLRGSDASR